MGCKQQLALVGLSENRCPKWPLDEIPSGKLAVCY